MSGNMRGYTHELTGQRFGMLEVIEQGPSVDGNATWLCKCDCGEYAIARSCDLTRGNKTDCGHVRREKCKPVEPGMRFGRWTVLCKCIKNGKYPKWACRCDCGTLGYVIESRLKSGGSKSCGCLTQDIRHARNKYDKRHNRLYKAWTSMKQRCYNPKHTSYKRYGALGVTICDEWRNNFGEFQKWAYENGYDPDAKYGECTLDRIDPYGNYEPSNCRWADAKTQANNRRCNADRRKSNAVSI